MTTNVDIVRSIYEAGTKGDINGMRPFLDPHIVIHEAASLPYGGEYHGLEGFSRLLAAVFSSWKTVGVE